MPSPISDKDSIILIGLLDSVEKAITAIETPGYFSEKELVIYTENPTLAVARGIMEGFKACLDYVGKKI